MNTLNQTIANEINETIEAVNQTNPAMQAAKRVEKAKDEFEDALRTFKFGASVAFGYGLLSLAAGNIIGVSAGGRNNLIGLGVATVVGGVATKYTPDLATGVLLAVGAGIVGTQVGARVSEMYYNPEPETQIQFVEVPVMETNFA